MLECIILQDGGSKAEFYVPGKLMLLQGQIM
jgi:hypothetical protein